jgi:uncharacterized OsmC-like protein
MSTIGDTGGADVFTDTGHLFVFPHQRRDGFWANIRGHALDLADPNSGHMLAPTPEDLLVASIASKLAWSARSFLRAHGLPDEVSVSAEWRTREDQQGLAELNLTVTVSRPAEAVRPALAASFDNIVATRCLAEPAIHLSLGD